MTAPTLRRLCQDKAYKFGHFVVEFATPGIGHILKGAGCDFVLFDTEHSGFSTDIVKSCVRYFEAAELPAIFRVPSKSYHHLARYADMGAEGIMVPLVNDAREAQELVSYVKYYPDGERGVGVGLAHDNYTGGAVAEKLQRLNERNCLFVQIETAAGVWARYCVGCHVIDGDGGSDGPELSHIGAKHDAAELKGWIADPEAIKPETDMPSFGKRLTPQQLDAIAQYLANRK